MFVGYLVWYLCLLSCLAVGCCIMFRFVYYVFYLRVCLFGLLPGSCICVGLGLAGFGFVCACS